MGWGELVVYDDGLVVKLAFQVLNFFQFALAQIGMAGSRELLGDCAYDLCPGAFGEEGEFVEGVLEAPKAFDASNGGSDEEGLLGGRVGGDVFAAAYGDLRGGVALMLANFCRGTLV